MLLRGGSRAGARALFFTAPLKEHIACGVAHGERGKRLVFGETLHAPGERFAVAARHERRGCLGRVACRGIGPRLHFHVDLAGGEACGELGHLTRARPLLPGQHGHDEERADEHGRERGSGVL